MSSGQTFRYHSGEDWVKQANKPQYKSLENHFASDCKLGEKTEKKKKNIGHACSATARCHRAVNVGGLPSSIYIYISMYKYINIYIYRERERESERERERVCVCSRALDETPLASRTSSASSLQPIEL